MNKFKKLYFINDTCIAFLRGQGASIMMSAPQKGEIDLANSDIHIRWRSEKQKMFSKKAVS